MLWWAGAIAVLAETERIVALHAWNPVDIPAELRDRYPWLLAPGEDVSRERMESLLADHLHAPPLTKVDRMIQQGSPLGEVLDIAEKGETDLVLVGRSVEDVYLSEKLARKAPCSVLSVPPQAPAKLQRVLVPVDYSSFSTQALEVAVAFAHASGAELTVLHAFTLPRGEAKATTTHPEIVTEFREIHTARLENMVSMIKTHGVRIHYHVIESSSAPSAVNAAVAAVHHDLVVIGCRGRHAIYATLLGSTAEAILHGCPVPVLAVKNQSTARNILAALRGN